LNQGSNEEQPAFRPVFNLSSKDDVRNYILNPSKEEEEIKDVTNDGIKPR